MVQLLPYGALVQWMLKKIQDLEHFSSFFVHQQRVSESLFTSCLKRGSYIKYVKRKGLHLVFAIFLPLSSVSCGHFLHQKEEKSAVWSRAEWQACTTCHGAAGERSTSLAARTSEELDAEMKCHYIDHYFCFVLFSVNTTLLPYSSSRKGNTGDCDNTASWGCWRQQRWEGNTGI